VIEEVFGGSRVVVVGIVAKQGDIFTPGILATIKTLTDEVKKIPGIKEENVISLADRKVKFVTATGDAIEVQRLMPEVPKTPEEIAAFKRRVFSNDLYLKSLISEDGRAAAIITDFREWVPTWKDGQGPQATVVQDGPKKAGGGWLSNPEDWNESGRANRGWAGGGAPSRLPMDSGWGTSKSVSPSWM